MGEQQDHAAGQGHRAAPALTATYQRYRARARYQFCWVIRFSRPGRAVRRRLPAGWAGAGAAPYPANCAVAAGTAAAGESAAQSGSAGPSGRPGPAGPSSHRATDTRPGPRASRRRGRLRGVRRRGPGASRRLHQSKGVGRQYLRASRTRPGRRSDRKAAASLRSGVSRLIRARSQWRRPGRGRGGTPAGITHGTVNRIGTSRSPTVRPSALEQSANGTDRAHLTTAGATLVAKRHNDVPAPKSTHWGPRWYAISASRRPARVIRWPGGPARAGPGRRARSARRGLCGPGRRR